MEHSVSRYITAGTIISSLGFSTEENMSRIRAYRSGISRIEDSSLFESPFIAARIDEERFKQAVAEQSLTAYTRMEQLFILSLLSTIRQSGVDPSDPECGLILSTTKGNIDALQSLGDFIPTTDAGLGENKPDPLLFGMAARIATYFQCVNKPILISNACISGVSALVVAGRLVETKQYKQILVAGGDLLTRFVVTGFQSFKSISPEICRPYDQARDGLSLGEACGAVLVTSDRQWVKEDRPTLIEGGAITNDANHISGPSRTGDGLYYAIHQAMREARRKPEDISFVNAHGTATPYNDEMESKALHWAGLNTVPLNSMKSYWGHTLGASGIIEVIACMEELQSGKVFGTLGYETCGIPYPLSLSAVHQSVSMSHCVKTASGFGGCNAAIVLALSDIKDNTHPASSQEGNGYHRHNELIGSSILTKKGVLIKSSVLIKKGKVTLNGAVVLEASTNQDFPAFIRATYKSLALDDRKFYKMDDLCKLGYMAAAYLLSEKGGVTGYEPGEVGMIFANASSSLDTDLKHQQIIDTLGDKEASPAVFVYTLPNVVMGELCIRYKIQGENTCFISDCYPESFIRNYAELVMEKQQLRACLIGWCELLGTEYEARFDWLEQIN